ncbi:hypothetical protein I3760_03G080300 [Carya illinoinensis]|nr:hypothetical protein I3760_03G080300 [Carya illinoinensis]
MKRSHPRFDKLLLSPLTSHFSSHLSRRGSKGRKSSPSLLLSFGTTAVSRGGADLCSRE